MTIKDLQRIVLTSESTAGVSPAMKELLKRTRDKRFFWIGNEKEHLRRHKETNSNCCFSHIIGLPKRAEPTVSRDLAHLKRRARENFRNWVDKELLNEYQKTLVGLTCIMKEAWAEAANSTGRNKIHALDLAQRAYQLRLELLTNNTVVEDSVRFIEGVKKKQEEELSSDSDTSLEEQEEEQEQELQEE